MGLDCSVRIDTPKVAVDEIWYGRKENAIHGWMQRQSGVPAEDFNCERLTLTPEILNLFESDMEAGRIDSTSGFFFGAAQDLEQIKEAAKDLLNIARKSLGRGEKPYYYSWW